MGSFNDLMLCGMNGHVLTPTQESWAGTLLESLSGATYFLAGRGGRGAPMKVALGAPPSAEQQLSGARCLARGHGRVTQRDIESFVARRVIPECVLEHLTSGRTSDLIDMSLSGTLGDAHRQRESARAQCDAAGLELSDSDEWMGRCPACGSNDIARYRWVPGAGMAQAADNLKLRGAP